MDNEIIVMVENKELHFKLQSQAIVVLEKVFGKNIFEIFQSLSFTMIQRVFWESLCNKDVVADANDMMDMLLKKYGLIELGNDLLQELAVKSGIIKASDLEQDESLEEIKND